MEQMHGRRTPDLMSAISLHRGRATSKSKSFLQKHRVNNSTCGVNVLNCLSSLLQRHEHIAVGCRGVPSGAVGSTPRRAMEFLRNSVQSLRDIIAGGGEENAAGSGAAVASSSAAASGSAASAMEDSGGGGDAAGGEGVELDGASRVAVCNRLCTLLCPRILPETG